MKRLAILFSIFTLLIVQASAFVGKAEVNGVWYYISTKGATAQVVQGDTKSTGDVTIPATIMYEDVECQVISIEEQAFMDSPELTSVTILADISSIGQMAFSNCPKLETVNLPSHLTQIEPGTFAHCTSLSAISLPDDIKLIGESAFAGCSSLQAIVFGPKVEEIDAHAFEGCEGLKEVNLPARLGFVYDQAFKNCTSMEKLFIRHQPTTPTLGHEAFAGCESLRELRIVSIDRFVPDDVFAGVDLEKLTLYYDDKDAEAIKDLKPWCYVRNTSPLTAADGLKKCADPIIHYDEGRLGLTCDTPGSLLYFTITSVSPADGVVTATQGAPSTTIELARTFEIEAYARGGDSDISSNTVSATIIWHDDGTWVTDGTFEDITDAIHRPEATIVTIPVTGIFDLQGRQLIQKPAKGVYIQDGKKHVVR